MAVNYEYYRCFYYVAKYRNLTLAASAMASSQPNVTRVMHNLEHELGCRLFIRSNRGISLTEEGEKLYSYVAVAFEQLRLGEETLTRSAGLQEGTVYLGTSETAMHELLLEEVRRFHAAYPAVRLKIRNCSTPQAISALRSGQIDFAVVASPVSIQPPLKRKNLKLFQDILISGPQFADLVGRKIRLADLAQYPLVCLARGTTAFEFYSKLYRDYGLELEADIEVATADLVLPMVRSGLGLGFLPYEFAREELQAGRVIRLDLIEPIPERHICLIQDEHRGLSVAARTFQKMLCEACLSAG